MAGLLAYCGQDCSVCPAYIATQANDLVAQERLVAEWRAQFGLPEMPFAAVVCDDCSALSGRNGGACLECSLRTCATGRGVASCAHCADYVCKTLEAAFATAPEVRERLEEIRHSLLA